MQLNIKDDETNALVSRLSAVTGQSKVSAVKDAVRRRLEQLESEREADIARRMAEVRRLTAEIRERLPRIMPTQQEFDDWLYDENGLPH